MNGSPIDVIILGQGLAGTTLAWSLRRLGARIIVVDRSEPITSSKIAAGLITPITGTKMIRSWRQPELWPVAETFYRSIEAETHTTLLSHPVMVRFFGDDQERVQFERRTSAGQYRGLTIKNYASDHEEGIRKQGISSAVGGFEMSPAGRLDVRAYLATSRTQFEAADEFLEADVDVSREIELVGDHVSIPRFNITANHLVFCQGYEPGNHPWFGAVELKPAKGEILTVRIPGLKESRVVHAGIWVAPLGGDLYRVGATYDWRHMDQRPTEDARHELEQQLDRLVQMPFEVVDHLAAVRPIHKNQYPVMGRHPMIPALSYFNGLGSKGSLQAPFFARQYAAHLINGTPLDPDVDLSRRTKFPDGLRPGITSDPSSAFHVKRTIRLPLTQQAQNAIREVIEPGDVVIDATAGNGHDTQFLAELVGPNGTVFAFDLQPEALSKTARRLGDAGLSNVVLVCESHSNLSQSVPGKFRGNVAAVMFNLGYLPGGDKGVTTLPTTTRPALDQAWQLIKVGGIISVVAYTGHDGGAAETETVEQFLASLPINEIEFRVVESQTGKSSGPRMFLVKRIG